MITITESAVATPGGAPRTLLPSERWARGQPGIPASASVTLTRPFPFENSRNYEHCVLTRKIPRAPKHSSGEKWADLAPSPRDPWRPGSWSPGDLAWGGLTWTPPVSPAQRLRPPAVRGTPGRTGWDKPLWGCVFRQFC